MLRCHLSLILILLAGAAVAGQTAARATAPADNEYAAGAILWMQSSGEARALAYQAYQLARLMLDRDLRLNRRDRRRRAVVVDIDETVLDNSRYQASLVLNGQKYDAQTWTAWCNRAEAAAVPGAVDFLKHAAARRVRVFYVTNRRPAEKAGTLANLKRLGFPDVSDETLLLQTDGASKEPRRRKIAERFRIVLLIGDNLNDFTDVFERQSVASRSAAVDRLRAQFGTRFIVLPNPMYGDWENAIYDYNFRLTDEEKAAKRKKLLRGY